MTRNTARATIAASVGLAVAAAAFLAVRLGRDRGPQREAEPGASPEAPRVEPTSPPGTSGQGVRDRPVAAGPAARLWTVAGRVIDVRADDVPRDDDSDDEVDAATDEESPARPVAGVRVRLGAPGAPSLAAVTDAEGAFEFREVPPGEALVLSLDEPGRCAAPLRIVVGCPAAATAWHVEWGGPGTVPRLDVGDVESGACESLKVEVTDPWDRPIAEARVRAGGGDEIVSGGTALSTDPILAEAVGPGAWVVRGLPPGLHGVRVEAPGWEATLETVRLPRAEPLRIALEPGSEVRGRVVDSSGRPIEGAAVRQLHASGDPARTDAEGRFALGSLGVYSTQIEANASGYVPLETTVSPGAEGLELRLLREARVAGTVVRASDGAPVPGAEVALEGQPAVDGPLISGSAGPLGTFDIGEIPPGSYRLSADHEDSPPSEAREIYLREGERVADLRLEFPEGLTRTVLVRDARSGAPIPGATVAMSGSERKTGSDGTCTVAGLEVGTASVSARARGYFPLRGAEVTIGDGPAPIELRLERGGTISVRVVGPDGSPVEGVRICTSYRPTLDATIVASTGADAEASAEHLIAWIIDGLASGLTDPDGRFRIDGLPRAVGYAIVASHRELAPGVATGIAVDPNGNPVELELRLARGGAIAARVESEDGDPVSGAEVQAEAADSPSPRWELRCGEDAKAGWFPSARTDASGAARLDRLPAGDFTVSATAEGRMPAEDATVRVEEGRDVALRLVLRTGHAVSGRVLSSSGEPAPGAEVRLSTDWRRSARSGPDGSFRLGGLEPGAAFLEAERPGFVMAVAVVRAPSDSVELRLAAFGRVSGRVAAPGRDWLPPGMSVEVDSLDPADATGPSSCELDRTGGFDVTLPPGRHRLTFGSGVPGLAGVSREVSVGPGERIRLDVELPPAANVSVLVVAAETGEPLDDAQVRAETPEGLVLPEAASFSEDGGGGGAEVSFEAGRHEFSVRAGPIVLRAVHPERRPRRIAGLSAVPGTTLQVVAALEAGTGIHGVVTRRGAPVAGARVTAAFPGRPADGEAWTDAAGRWEIALVGTEERTIRAEAPDGRAVATPAFVQPNRWYEHTIDLSWILLRGRVLSGGEPFAAAWVIAQPSTACELIRTRPGADGAYEALLPTAGRYRVHFGDEEGTRYESVEVLVPEDATAIERDLELP